MPDLSVIQSAASSNRTGSATCSELEDRSVEAAQLFVELSDWLSSQGCKVQPRLIEEYALAIARWREVEKIISADGFIAPHPTTGADMASPLVGVSNTYFKQMHAAWYAIWDVIKQSAEPETAKDEMEELLSSTG